MLCRMIRNLLIKLTDIWQMTSITEKQKFIITLKCSVIYCGFSRFPIASTQTYSLYALLYAPRMTFRNSGVYKTLRKFLCKLIKSGTGSHRCCYCADSIIFCCKISNTFTENRGKAISAVRQFTAFCLERTNTVIKFRMFLRVLTASAFLSNNMDNDWAIMLLCKNM